MGNNLAKIFSAELEGIEAKLIEVEVDINVGLHSFTIVGLADKAVSEAKERVNAALKNSGIKPPTKENRRITINLAPADIKKSGSQFDLGIALGYLLASEQIKPFETRDKLFIGELSLDGSLRPVNGALNTAFLAKKCGVKYLFLPPENAEEAAVVKDVLVMPVTNLDELIRHLEEKIPITPHPPRDISFTESSNVSFAEIKGHEHAKRALAIAAAGGHHVLMTGSPGTGKTMLAQALTSILPQPTIEELIEINQIYSAAGMLKEKRFIEHRPFRAPHHSASPASIIGGGTNPRPGEISLAHRGVLFADELPEFRRDLLEALRQPLESGVVHISRAKSVVAFPAKFMLVAAMNPCPCGYFNDPEKECRCSAYEVFKYQKKVSGPLLDRIDIQIDVPRVNIKELTNKEKASRHEEARQLQEQIARARKTQEMRLTGRTPRIFSNSEMSGKDCDELIHLDTHAEQFLKRLLENSFISARGYYRILKTAQTIADIEQSEKIKEDHLAEAFHYRIKEEK